MFINKKSDHNLHCPMVPPMVPPWSASGPRSMGDRGTREDDLTVAVGQIVEANTALQQQLARGFPRQILEAWDAHLDIAWAVGTPFRGEC
jgi:hypothetical protein